MRIHNKVRVKEDNITIKITIFIVLLFVSKTIKQCC